MTIELSEQNSYGKVNLLDKLNKFIYKNNYDKEGKGAEEGRGGLKRAEGAIRARGQAFMASADRYKCQRWYMYCEEAAAGRGGGATRARLARCAAWRDGEVAGRARLAAATEVVGGRATAKDVALV